ncbi:diguanylate cyclase (GGDEF) domain-containing protein [Arsukibacterium tuosuense]|uniref:diguanylate cyclase n=1 Tax=Arsukibacterium tuosuense TaxID=1323745 RepID=A0A285ISK1_9GAMM|nr:diguanylate cyclase [Arsukibacterium tuosuense]SNY51005.1 diguanylate cyclase (GGDEF) domain-containing protein [Arsukibacterium tuosuense]
MPYQAENAPALLSWLRSSVLLRHSLLFILWLAVWMLGLLVEYTEHASVWFPAAGLTFAALFIVGLRILPVLLLACVVITFWTVHYYQLQLTSWQTLQGGFLFGLAHIVPYYLGSQLLRRLAITTQCTLPLFVIGFILLAASSALIATWTVIAALVFAGMMSISAVSATWLPFWVGDMAGVIVLAPLFAAILSVFYPATTSLGQFVGPGQRFASRYFIYKLLLNLVLLSLAMLLANYADTPESAFAIFFLVIPHMWIACTESAFYTTLSVAISSFAIALLVNIFALMDYVMVYQFAIVVIGANALFGLAVPALMASNNQLRLVASTDSLTRVASRDYLQQRSELEISRSLQQDEPLCLMVFDIDHFKQINDKYGHSTGDQVLLHACQQAQQILRPADVIGRYGGDEFVVILPNTAKEAVVAIGNRIIERLQQIELAEQLTVSASFGVAALQPGDSFRSLFERADAALYRAKQQGRSQVAWH